MASLRRKYDKDNKLVSCQIRVFRGRDSEGNQLTPYCTTWRVPEGMTAKKAESELKKFAATFERDCKAGIVADSRQRFDEYSLTYVNSLKRRNASAETIEDYQERLARINAAIGYMKLSDICVRTLENFYDGLLKEGARVKAERAYAKVDIKQLLKEKGMTMKQVCDGAHISDSTLRDAVHGKALKMDTANKIAAAIGVDLKAIFEVRKNNEPLSNITVLGYHRVISAVLSAAVKEGIIRDNPAAKATPPSATSESDPRFFEIDEIQKILEVADKEPLYWRALVHLLAATGARRGEILGLTWDDIDFVDNQIAINKSVSAAKGTGVYIHPTKTKSSIRRISVPEETMSVLREYKAWYDSNSSALNTSNNVQRFLFARVNRGSTTPITPSAVNHYLNSLSAKCGLPHINPHAFRHTQASMLICGNTDIATAASRLGHSKPATTLNIYTHVMNKMDRAASDTIANALFRKKDNNGD